MPCPHNPIEKQVLREIKPSEKDYKKARKIAEKTLTLIEKTLKDNIEARIEGSFAKDTWLKNDLDIDVFLLLPRKKCNKETIKTLVELLEKELKNKNIPVYREYAQHPYLSIIVEETKIELVPACKIKEGEKPLTPADRTPLHTQYINKTLTSEQKDEVRLLKKFLKTLNIYGAETRIQGFSGYLTELLIAKYKCFQTLIKNTATWKPPVILEINEKHKQTKTSKNTIKTPKQPLIVPDPVDPERNTAAAVSLKSLSTLILASNLYLKTQCKFFFYKPKSKTEIRDIVKNAGTRSDKILLVVASIQKEQPEETLYGIAKRTAKNIEKILQQHNIITLNKDIYVHKRKLIIIAIEALNQPLLYQLKKGPYPWITEHTIKYIERSKKDRAIIGPWIGEDGRLYSLAESKHRDLIEILEHQEKQWRPPTLRAEKIEYTTLKHIYSSTLIKTNIIGSEEFLEWLKSITEKTPHWISKCITEKYP